MIRTKLARPPRRGFTLIELLAVIAIIGLLAAISIGAYFRVRVSQQEKAAETTLTKIQLEFDNQWRAVLDSAKLQQMDQIPGPVHGLAANDNRRTRVIWSKIRLKQEFPQNFWEALIWPQGLAQNYGIYLDMKYKTQLTGVVAQDPATLSVDRQMRESAVLLYMSVTKGRRGNTAFNAAEHVGPHAVGKIQLDVAPGVVREFDVFIDAWDQPIGFVRWPFGAAASDLNAPPHQATNKNGQPIDPQDPEKTLLDNDWFNNPNQYAATFATMVGHPLNNPPLNLSPVIFSAGRDKLPGILLYDSGLGHAGYFQRVNGDEDDNINAFRFKGVGKAN